MLRKRLITVVLVCLAAAGVAHPGQDPREQDEPVKLKTDLVTVSASVTDPESRALRSLKQSDFKIFEDGVEQKITHFAATEEPFSLVLLLDISGSTAGDIALMKEAAGNFVEQLRTGEQIGVVVFSRQVSEVSGLKASRPHTEAAVAAITPTVGTLNQRYTSNTGTSFYDALDEAADRLKGVEGRKAVVCMSDGVDSTSRKTFTDVAGPLERGELSVYFLQLNTEQATLDGLMKPRTDPTYINLSASQLNRYFSQRDPESPMRGLKRDEISPLILREINAGLYEIARSEMKGLAERTGGHVYPVKSLDDLKHVYRQVADDLRSQYSIGYYPLNQARDGRWRQIRVEVARPGAKVRARSGYWAPRK
jgi:VWFA-related protein